MKKIIVVAIILLYAICVESFVSNIGHHTVVDDTRIPLEERTVRSTYIGIDSVYIPNADL